MIHQRCRPHWSFRPKAPNEIRDKKRNTAKRSVCLFAFDHSPIDRDHVDGTSDSYDFVIGQKPNRARLRASSYQVEFHFEQHPMNKRNYDARENVNSRQDLEVSRTSRADLISSVIFTYARVTSSCERRADDRHAIYSECRSLANLAKF